MNAVELTKELIKIDSTDPGAYEQEIGDYLDSLLSGHADSVAKSEVLPGRSNVMAILNGADSQQELVFICHMDTVTVGDGWTRQPFGAEEENGRIYGRGACDMKSGLACALSAFLSACEYKKGGKQPAHTLKFIASVDEEDFMRGVEKVIADGWVSENSLVLDTEPTNGQIQVAHKGRTWFELTVTGVTAHASTPWKGADAIAAMAEILVSIREQLAATPIHPDLGKSTVTFGQITGGYRPYVVPDRCKVWIDMRLVPPVTTEKAVEIVETAIAKAKAREAELAKAFSMTGSADGAVAGCADGAVVRCADEAVVRCADKAVVRCADEAVVRCADKASGQDCESAPAITASWQLTGNRPYIEKDEHAKLLQLLTTAQKSVTGASPIVSFFPGYTDTAVIAGTLHNPNCMSYGPGNLELAHKPDEYVPVADIERCEQVLTELVMSYLRLRF